MKAAGIIFTDGKSILLLKRKEQKFWEIPGGKSKAGETNLENAKREAKEECGRVSGKEFASYSRDNFTVFFFKTTRFNCRISKEHLDWKWVDFKDLDNIKLRPELKTDKQKMLDVIKKELTFKEWFEFTIDS